MYYPYLRGKLHEVSALDELGDLLAERRNVCPILEPVRKSSTSTPFKKLESLAEYGFPLGIVENPVVGDFMSNNQALRSFLLKSTGRYENIIPALVVDPATQVSVIRSFAERWSGRKVIVVHLGQASLSTDLVGRFGQNENIQVFRDGRTSSAYREQFGKSKRALLVDGFNRMPKNESYPSKQLFAEILGTHRERGYSGFGDYSIVGDHFSESGGQALAVAIHWTTIESGVLWTRHFLSDRTTGRGVDTAGKFFEALGKLCRFIRSERIESRGADSFLGLLEEQHYPGLGVVKRFSIKHHIELVSTNMTR
jgi:hypothetical protein